MCDFSRAQKIQFIFYLIFEWVSDFLYNNSICAAFVVHKHIWFGRCSFLFLSSLLSFSWDGHECVVKWWQQIKSRAKKKMRTQPKWKKKNQHIFFSLGLCGDHLQRLRLLFFIILILRFTNTRTHSCRQSPGTQIASSTKWFTCEFRNSFRRIRAVHWQHRKKTAAAVGSSNNSQINELRALSSIRFNSPASQILGKCDGICFVYLLSPNAHRPLTDGFVSCRWCAKTLLNIGVDRLTRLPHLCCNFFFPNHI